ncbi:hypothetical protein CHRY9390_02900 [Chryseobacterium aquaeductus]|uniref:Uncharacterized protein n=1 Tax=Chryseobacterium aquaeductus TaxID=2675056 RepID=A0A9N8MI48_9FLAO|nr:hypothetical protein [Chryseobacterium aquaeductus]CAA7332179.1 hypothetical protein CHRY9390_02900 [Chryseobacterium potabilaquae]CAD7815004.1 hypothetical protein CHRY9390_02900 [Chryseobacterium aquaeductus]
MIFEEQPHAVHQEMSSMPHENFKFITNIINFTGDKSFILTSLQKIQSSTLCEIKKNTIDKFIKEYALNFDGFVENDIYSHQNDKNQVCPVFAKKSFEKVMREQEYLNRLVSILNTD